MMNNLFQTNRRQFLSGIMPVCALACFSGSQAVAMQEMAKHKFDQELGQALTLRRYFRLQFDEMIKLASALEKEWGKEKTIDFLKRTTQDRMLEYGRKQAKKLNDDSFKTYVDTFRGPAFKDVLTMEIVEDTDTVFELKVTECIWARTFLDADAGEIGFAHVCFGDYFWPKGFNPKISMERDKTLMQGHALCNHRYCLND
ncbi:MAG: L-2-amino-thiazoline-4-carboxylic acid hydrolase [Planctomycetota bacterium]